jgi:uncharacterized repeat protein (TIGR02543 family)
MIKKVLAVVLALSVMLPCGVGAESIDRFEGHWELDTTRTVIFASDGGTYIHPTQQEIGTVICLDEYVPIKDGYIFDGWYSDPRTKEQQVTEVTLNENIVVFAKWIDDGTPKAVPEMPVIASTEEILAYGNYIDEATGVPVTALWVQQNARLNELMQIYNQKFN